MSLDLGRLAGRATEVAPALLGAVLTSTLPQGRVAVRLSEVEAYDGANDPGSHAYRGATARNTVMFGPPGHVYVYRSYGLHWCMNVVCGSDGTASAVLLRAGRVVEGAELARSRRGAAVPDKDLARGPARLTQALGVRGELNGTALNAGPLALELPDRPAGAVSAGPRVGISRGEQLPWRFWLTADPTVSAYRAGTKRR